MAREKPENKEMDAATRDTKFVRLELPIELHRQLRLEAAKQERSMAWLAREIIKEHFAPKRKSRP